MLSLRPVDCVDEMRRGRGRPSKNLPQSSKTPTLSSATNQHGGHTSPRVSSAQVIKTRGSRPNTARKYYAMDSSDSDSDNESISSRGSSTSNTPTKKIRYVEPLKAVTPVNLAPSSDDLLLDPEHVLPALGIYEVLRHFGRIIRLSPFRFEDFCGAIKAPNQSSLLAQIHLALLRFLLSEDDASGLTFVASDEKDSFNIHMYCLGEFTWPDVIRSYIMSDKTEFGDVTAALNASETEDPFPFTSVEKRLKILHRLCDQFLASNSVRYDIMNEGMAESEDHCRNCCKMGDLLCCENCPAVYHLHCLKPPLEVVPDGDWLCPVCEVHQLKGVTDCSSDWNRDGWLRNTPLGVDREGRKYWFIARRLFVEGNDGTLYYSCKAHLDELINSLEEDGKERRLLSMIKAKYKVMIKHMEITEALIESSRGDLPSGLTKQRPRLVKRKEEAATIPLVKEEMDPDVEINCSDDRSLSELSEVKEAASVEDDVAISRQTPSPSSAILTFVPDKDVKEIVTRPQVDNTITSSAEKQMVLRDRRSVIQDSSPYRRRRLSVVLEHSTLSTVKGGELNKVPIDELEADSAEMFAKSDSDIPCGLADKKACVSENKMDAQSPDTKHESGTSELASEPDNECLETSECIDPVKYGSGTRTPDTSTFTDKSENESKISGGNDNIIIKGIQGTSEPLHESKEESTPSKKFSVIVTTVSKPSLPNSQFSQSKSAISNTEVSSTLSVKKDVRNPALKDNEPVVSSSGAVCLSINSTKSESRVCQEVSDAKEVEQPVFRLGQEGNYSSYVNQFRTNTLALNKQQQMEQRDKKRSVSHKFSLNEFKWHGDTCGTKEVILNTLRFSVVGLENAIPSAFMHPSWPVQRSTWVRAVHMSKTPKEFAAALSFLESSIRPICYLSVWNDSVGHVELRRVISEARHTGIKKKDHKEEEEESELDRKGFVNYTWMPHHQVWKQKGEEYRLFGGGGWVWTSGLQCRKRKRVQDKKDTFVNKKRKLLDTTNKISAAKAKKRADALQKEALKPASKVGAHQVLPQSGTKQTEKNVAPQQGVLTTSTATPVHGTAQSSNTSTVQTAPLLTSSMVQSNVKHAPISSSSLIPQSSTQSTAASVINTTSSAFAHSVTCTSSEAHSKATPSSQVMSKISSALPTPSPAMASASILAHPTIQPVTSANGSVIAEPLPSSSSNVKPTTPSQEECSRVIPVSIAAKAADHATCSLLSKSPLTTTLSPTEVLPTKTVAVESPLSTSTSSLFSSSSEATGVNNTFSSISSNSNLVNCSTSTTSFTSSISKQSLKKTTEDLDLESILSIEDRKIVDIARTELPTTSLVSITSTVPISKAPENPSTVSEPENGFSASKITDAAEINTSGDCFPPVGDVLSDVAMDTPFDNGSTNSLVGVESLKKHSDDQNSSDTIIEVGESLAILNSDILHLDDQVKSVESTETQKTAASNTSYPEGEMLVKENQGTLEIDSCATSPPVSDAINCSQPQLLEPTSIHTNNNLHSGSVRVRETAAETLLTKDNENCETSSLLNQFSAQLERRDSKDELLTEVPDAPAENNKQDDVESSGVTEGQSGEPVDEDVIKKTNFASCQILPCCQRSNTQEMPSLTAESNLKENEVMVETEIKGNDNSVKTSFSEGDLKGSKGGATKHDSQDVSNSSTVKNDSNCAESKLISDKGNAHGLCKTDKKNDASSTENNVSSITTEDEVRESGVIESSVTVPSAGLATHAATYHQRDEQRTALVIPHKNTNERAPGQTVCENSVEGLGSIKPSSCYATEHELSKSLTNVEVSSSSGSTDVSTTTVSQSLSASEHEERSKQDELIDVDVTSLSPSLKPSSVTLSSATNDLHGDSCSRVVPPAEGTATQKAFPAKKSGVEGERSRVCGENVLPKASSTLISTGSSAASTVSLFDKFADPNATSTSNGASSLQSIKSSESVSKQSTPSLSGPTQVVISSDNSSKASPTFATATTSSRSVQLTTSSVSVSSDKVVRSTLQGVVPGNSQSPKGLAVTVTPSVVNTTVRGIPLQKTPIKSRPQGQSSHCVPTVHKPILPSPRPLALATSTSVQGSNVTRGSVQTSSSSQSSSAPVKSIAALVASLPTSAATISPSQLIRLVSSDGRSIILQGSQIAAALAQQAGSQLGLAVPKSITLQVSGAAIQQSPSPRIPKTVGATTSSAIITVQRPQHQAAQIKPQIVVKPKMVAKPVEEEKFPSLEPLTKDPRSLLNRRLARWPLRHSVKSVFALKKHDLRRLGRKAGMKEVSGYAYSSRAVGVNWPSGIPRPLFKVAWRFRTQSLKTLAGAGLQLRILHSCLKWDEMNVRPPRGNSNTVFTSSGTTTTEITDRKFVSADGLSCKYMVRKVVRTLTRPVVEPPKPTPTKSMRGRTLRPKIVLQPADDDDERRAANQPIVLEAWYPEAKLELWEIRQYHERIEREKALEREKKEQQEALKRAAELRAAANQRKQQEQQARQQQQHLLKMNKKKVQNAIKTQQKKIAVLKPAVASPSVTYKPTVAPPVPPGVLRRTLPVLTPTVSTKLPGTASGIAPQMRTQIARLALNRAATPHVQRLQPKPTVIQRVNQTQAASSQITRAHVPVTPLGNTVARPVTLATGTPTLVRGTNPLTASRMKHSSKEQIKQASKAKSRKGGGAAGTPMLHNKKYMTMEARQDTNRIAICRKVLDFMLDKIDRNEEIERRKEEKKRAKEETQALKLEKQKASKLGMLLQKRKEALKKEIVRKRDLLERDLMLELQHNHPNKRRKERTNSQSTPEGPKAKKRKTEDERLFCVCKTPYDPTQFYVGCDMCANWFHGACVQVTPETAKNMDEWTCADCTQARRGVEEEELYCLCRQPYDERKFYIGCDKCQDWFHGACVGITAAEAENIEFYTCPRCSQSQAQENKQPLTAKDYDSLKRLLRSLQSHKMAWPFLEPVSADEVPDYHEVITDPIDLSTVEERMNSKAYPSLESFVSDITKIFDNCRYFNQ